MIQKLHDDVRLKDLIVAIPRDWVLVCGSWNVARRVTTVKIPIQRIGIDQATSSENLGCMRPLKLGVADLST
jgi:hypothetical protein